MAELRWGTATDSGRIRPGNEDNLLADAQLFIVADGMGGHRAGEVASALAVDLLRSRLAAEPSTLEDVVAAVADANDDIYRSAVSNPEQQGMGTTVTGLVVISTAPAAAPDVTTEIETPVDQEAQVQPGAADGSASDEADAARGGAESDDEPSIPRSDDESDDGPVDGERFALINVGDSRTYLMRHERLRRVTVDHSYVQELVATGHITDDEARTHPRRNIVTRALGIDPSVRVDAWTLPIVRGDRFLLCSDGLVDEVRDDAIVAVLTNQDDPQAAADELVALANRQGGRDNITVIVVDVLAGVDAPDADSELDPEPAWEDAGTAGTWAVDAPEGEATTFDDLAALVSGDDEPAGADGTTAIAGATPPDTAEEPP